MPDEYAPYLDATRPDDEWTWRGGGVRLPPGTVRPDGSFASGGGPYINANAGHIRVGMMTAFVNSAGDLEVKCDGAAITTAAATADETLTQRGIWCGPSGAAGTMRYRFYRVGTGRLYLNQQAHWDMVSGHYANVWMLWGTCTTRGVGLPSKPDRALAGVAALEQASAAQAGAMRALDRRVQRLEAAVTPGSLGRWGTAHDGQTFGDVNTAHDGQTFATFNVAAKEI